MADSVSAVWVTNLGCPVVPDGEQHGGLVGIELWRNLPINQTATTTARRCGLWLDLQ